MDLGNSGRSCPCPQKTHSHHSPRQRRPFWQFCRVAALGRPVNMDCEKLRQAGRKFTKQQNCLMDGKGWRIKVCQPADLIPGLFTILVLKVGREVLKYETIHSCGPVLAQRGSLIEWEQLGIMPSMNGWIRETGCPAHAHEIFSLIHPLHVNVIYS